MLDPKGKKEIHELIATIRENNPDLTVISITHDVEEAYSSDEVVILNHGKVVVTGNPKEVMKDEEMMTSLNLRVPYSVRLAKALNKAGFNIPEDASVEEIGEMVCQSK